MCSLERESGELEVNDDVKEKNSDLGNWREEGIEKTRLFAMQVEVLGCRCPDSAGRCGVTSPRLVL